MVPFESEVILLQDRADFVGKLVDVSRRNGRQGQHPLLTKRGLAVRANAHRPCDPFAQNDG